MVAKGFMAAAAIIICCATTLQGNDQETKCTGGDCPTACSDKEKCSAETTACADGKCDDKEECCEKEQVSLEKCSTGKCSKEQVSVDNCSTEKCSTGACAKSKCSTGTCDKQKCSTDKCSTEKCTAGKTGGEKCAFTTTLGGLCEPLRCALEATPISIGVTVQACSKSECNASACEGETCPVAACANQVCDALKCAVESCTTAATGDCPQKTVCATGSCGTTQCATLECSSQDCPAGECIEGFRAVEGNSGQRYGLNASLTAAGGEFVISTEKWFPGTPVAEKCSAETECSKAICSTEKTATSKCAGKCAKSASLEVAAAPAVPASVCTTQGKCVDAPAERELADAVARLEAKIAAIERRHAEVSTRRAAVEPTQMYVVEVKVVELNKSKCRSLGFDLEVAGGNAACEFVGQTLEALVKRNLAKVLFNPTLCVTSHHPASFQAGAEIAPKIYEGKEGIGFVGKKLDVLATPAGESKVRLHIAPTMSELDLATQNLPKIKTIKWDFDYEATLGKPMVLKGSDEHRFFSEVIEGRGMVSEVEQVETMLIVTVNSLENVDRQADVKQTAYEQDLVDAVKAPEFFTKVYPVPDLQVWKVRPQGVQFDADLLIAHIKSTIDAQSWRGFVYADPQQAERANGAIRPFERNGSLVICQTEENHKQIAKLLTKMRVDGQAKDAAREERELHDGSVTPASAEESIEAESKCSKGECSKSKVACSESKCTGSECSKSQVSLESAPSDECPGDCQGQCDGKCPETAECPCIGGACTR